MDYLALVCGIAGINIFWHLSNPDFSLILVLKIESFVETLVFWGMIKHGDFDSDSDSNLAAAT